MKIYCGDADCEGVDRENSEYCPCTNQHQSINEILIDYLISQNLAKYDDDTGKLMLWVEASYVPWDEIEFFEDEDIEA